MKKLLALSATALTLALPAVSCASADVIQPVADSAGAIASPVTDDGSPNPNFLLLLSDAPNDIGDFDELWVTIAAIGFVQGDEEGIIEYPLDDPVSVNLVTLTGENAIALWEGLVPEGTYTKVFLYIDEAWGILSDSDGAGPISVKLPSGKLQVNVPVAVDGDDGTEQVEYVFDVTVHRAGNSGTYILSPQLCESGAGMKYRLLVHTEERVRTGKPDWSGKPADAGVEGTTSGENTEAGPPQGTGKPDATGPRNENSRPDGVGKPEHAGVTHGKS